ncbi:MAG: ATP-dependent DNA helicase RecG [Oscillospiraceae bacterium]|jgi:ATP-dependent DNA helicase RecG|nr:ATP-dependent DNA helicase RecG [Oscillospiraceae bacterium]
MNARELPLTKLRGVSEARAKLFAKLGAESVYELVLITPRDYEDRTEVKSVSSLTDGESVCVSVVAGEPRLSRTQTGLTLVKLRAADDTGVIDFAFFNQPYVRDNIKAGGEYVFFGKAEVSGTSVRMTNPVYEKRGEADTGDKTRRVVPVYRLTAGLSQYNARSAARQALDLLGDVPDILPQAIRAKYKLCDARFAYENIHFPPDFIKLAIAGRRLLFAEMLTVALASRSLKRGRGDAPGRVLDVSALPEFYAALPFAPTAGQTGAIDDAARDCVSGRVMTRLVQGDVGSGKTVVAMALCFASARSGSQAAFMAPTELLASQHFDTFTKILGPLGVRVLRLTGSLTAKKRAEARAAIASGECDVVVGTHAIISDGVEFRDLALVVTDEQHRFGVGQRANLSAKGGSPHALVMSATPIPRTLSLILFGDLDVSTIRELPPGRLPVKTFVYSEAKRGRLYESVRKLAGEGRQIYFICPAVEESENPDSGLKPAVKYARELAETVFPELAVGLVHGAMKPKDKDAAMRRFVSGETDVLVATTVVEVGVDVPNAALIVIENADRFGLSQLHQLRGRVGRGGHASFCVLFGGSGGEAAKERLQTLCSTNDGFEIAEADLLQRGPGDFFGTRQHGLSADRLAVTDPALVEEVGAAADELLADDPKLKKPEHNGLRDAVAAMMRGVAAN